MTRTKKLCITISDSMIPQSVFYKMVTIGRSSTQNTGAWEAMATYWSSTPSTVRSHVSSTSALMWLYTTLFSANEESNRARY